MKTTLKTIVLGLLLGSFFTNTPLSLAQFYDSAEFPSWSLDAIDKVNKAGIMTGFGDKTFRADQKLTRAEIVTVLLRSKKVNEEDVKVAHSSRFPDVPIGVWFERPLVYAESNGWVKGRPDGKFYPGDNLTRAEFVTLIARAFDLEAEVYDPEVIEFSDVDPNAWFAKSLAGLYEKGLLRNGRNKFYRPGNIISRADAAWTFAQIMDKPGIYEPEEFNYDEGTSSYADSKRVAIRPRDFNPEKQGFDIEKEELYAWVETASDEVTLKTSLDQYKLFGNVRVQNRLEFGSELDTLRFKVRIEQNDTGPINNFFAKVEGAGISKEIRLNRTGEAIFTGLDLKFETQEEQVFKFYLKPDVDGSFYKRNGSATVNLSLIEGVTFKPFLSTNRVADLRSAPIGYGDRGLSKLKFEVE